MEKIKELFEKLRIPYNEVQGKQLMGYMEEILDRNQYINLTAIRERDQFIEKHYLDSLLCIDSPEFVDAKRIIDVGTGAGFPGIPLAVAFPEKDFLLVDSLNKRIKIVEELCRSLAIDNVKVMHGRAEELARRKELRESFDLCVSRAVANLSTLSEYCLPFVEPGGTFIAYKGPDCSHELEEAKRAIEILGGSLSRTERPEAAQLPFQHTLIYIKKTKNTTAKYPRKAGIPSKEPVL